MVAISLYRGNLHRVPDVPRRWLMPKPSISLKDFRSLIQKRDKTISRFTTTDNPNPITSSEFAEEKLLEENGVPLPIMDNINMVEDAAFKQQQEQKEEDHRAVASAEDQIGLHNGSILEQPGETVELASAPDVNSTVAEAVDDNNNGGDGGNSQCLEKEPVVGINTNVNLLSGKEGEKKEVEKLQMLNEKKHNLVQMLKQILNAEEEMKR